MEDKGNLIESLFEKVGEYGNTSYELIRLKTLNKTSGIVSNATLRLIVFCTIFLFILLFSIGIGLWLGEFLGKMYYGFFIVAGSYAVIAVVLYFFLGNWIKQRISNSIITQVLN